MEEPTLTEGEERIIVGKYISERKYTLLLGLIGKNQPSIAASLQKYLKHNANSSP